MTVVYMTVVYIGMKNMSAVRNRTTFSMRRRSSSTSAMVHMGNKKIPKPLPPVSPRPPSPPPLPQGGCLIAARASQRKSAKNAAPLLNRVRVAHLDLPDEPVSATAMRWTPLVAATFSGQYRAFEHVYPTVRRHVTQPFGGTHVSFVFITPEPPCSGGVCKRGSVRHVSSKKGEWTNVSDMSVRASLLTLPCGGYFVYGSWSAPSLAPCKQDSMFAKHAQQWEKVQHVFHLVELYETQQRIQFDWVLRLRTDLFFLAPVPHHSTLAAGVHVPLGMTTGTSLNDQLAIASRAHASSYFELADELSCSGNWSGSWSTPVSDNASSGGLMLGRLRRWRAPVHLHAFGYVLVRPAREAGGHVYECGRLQNKYVPQTRQFYSSCLQLCRALVQMGPTVNREQAQCA